MKLIQNNPYRIAGILSNSSEKDILKQKSKIKRFAEVGKTISSEYDFPFLSPLERNSAITDKAFSDIEQNQDKITHALFWFVNITQVDETAIQHLISDNKDKAIEIWEKITNNKEVNSKNYSAFNNLASLYLLEGSKQKVAQGIMLKTKLIESEGFKELTRLIADETFATNPIKQAQLFADELLVDFNKRYSMEGILFVFKDCNTNIRNYVSKKIADEPIHKIETKLGQCSKKRSEDGAEGFSLGMALHQNTKDDLVMLKGILGDDNLEYKMLIDNVAKEILQCAIDYFNISQEREIKNNSLEEAKQLATIAHTLAVNDTTKNKVKENLKTLEEMKDRELKQAVEALKGIKSAYENNKLKITSEVSRMPLGYNQTINWTKVNKMIESSLNWDKVVGFVIDAIPIQNIEKIKNSENITALNEFKSLMEFLITKLNFSQVNQVKYICYWKTENTVSNVELTVKSLPIWVKWAGGIAIFLLIVGLIWGEEGISAVFAIAMILGVLTLIGWLRTL